MRQDYYLWVLKIDFGENVSATLKDGTQELLLLLCDCNTAIV